MTREIKFRAWNGERMIDEAEAFSEMYLIGFGGTIRKVHGHTDWENKEHFHGTELIEHLTLMQYTGLKDKNGKEIYEGDILCITDEILADIIGGHARYEPENRIESVFWSDTSACWVTKTNSIAEDYLDSEVIGNIYENKELLT